MVHLSFTARLGASLREDVCEAAVDHDSLRGGRAFEQQSSVSIAKRKLCRG